MRINGPVVLVTYLRKYCDITENLFKAAKNTKQSIIQSLLGKQHDQDIKNIDKKLQSPSNDDLVLNHVCPSFLCCPSGINFKPHVPLLHLFQNCSKIKSLYSINKRSFTDMLFHSQCPLFFISFPQVLDQSFTD